MQLLVKGMVVVKCWIVSAKVMQTKFTEIHQILVKINERKEYSENSEWKFESSIIIMLFESIWNFVVVMKVQMEHLRYFADCLEFSGAPNEFEFPEAHSCCSVNLNFKYSWPFLQGPYWGRI